MTSQSDDKKNPDNEEILAPTSSKRKTKVRKMSFLNKQTKIKLPLDWKAIPYEFNSSIMSLYQTFDFLFFGLLDSSVVLLNPTNFEYQTSYFKHKGCINCLSSDPSSGLIASASGDGSVHLWQVVSNHISSNSILLMASECPVLSVSFFQGQIVAGSKNCSNSGSLCVWDLIRSEKAIQTKTIGSSVMSLDVNQLGLAAGLDSGLIQIFDSNVDSCQISMSHPKGKILSLKYVECDYPRLVSAANDKSVRDWDLRNPSEPTNIYEIDHVPTKIDVKDGFVIVPNETGKIFAIDLEKHSLLHCSHAPFSYTISQTMFLKNQSNKFIAGSWDGSASLATYVN